MVEPRTRGLLLAGIAALAIARALPVIGQTGPAPKPGDPAATAPANPAPQPLSLPPAIPKSILPEGFEAPAPAPTSTAIVLPNAAPEPSGPNLLPPASLSRSLQSPDAPVVVDPFAAQANQGILVTGPLSVASGGFGAQTFNRSNGIFLAGLLNRIDRPLASRWALIILRRALLSQAATPFGINDGDWVASRAWVLLRSGELDGAKLLVDAMPVDRYTPALYRIAGQVALAGADIAGLCPIARTGRVLSRDSMWKLAVGMCAAIEGDDITAATVFDAMNGNDSGIDGFDVRLGERIATIAGGAGRASSIDWNEAPPLTLYRFGIATSAGVAVPIDRLAALGPARHGWLVRIPGVSPEARLASLRDAAILGSMSTIELVSAVTALSPGNPDDDSRAGLLRLAFAGGSSAARLAAMKSIQNTAGDHYGGLLESAPAAALLPVSSAAADASADIIAALLAAGEARAALRWWPIADKAGGKVRANAWALLATGSGGVTVTPAEFKAWQAATSADDRRAGLLLAALAGLGASNDGGWDGLRGQYLPRAATSWSRAIDAAARAGRGGEVAILAATGLQGRWGDVPPQHLNHIIAALVRSGRPVEARLLAAEAVTRG